MNQDIPISVLDLSPILKHSTAAQAFRNTLDLARHAEKWGYKRYWLAEHHNMPGIASAATSVVIGYVAGGTTTIRVGAGGVMMPNHAPLVIAEQYGTLESLYPGRIDLGLGRAPGTDQQTARALRRNLGNIDEQFPRDVLELQDYFRAVAPGQAVRAVPGAGLNVPIWLLGSSLFSAQLAALLGLPYAFASHFAPDYLMAALALYRNEFRPSETLQSPYAMACISVIAAETNAEAARLRTSLEEQFINLRRGTPGPLNPPLESTKALWNDMQSRDIQHVLRESVVGSPDTVRDGIAAFIEKTQVNELMVTGQIFDHAARLRSFEIIAEVASERSSYGSHAAIIA